ncbi:hypothetical protein ABZ725_47160 [Streptomyces sp. NPDC006872]|uniref:hypothetical protein n=1 Tax=Streptomyces sp. NPDC006872 TaxID=3155720 RepID=UPI0033CBCE29
MPGTPDEPDFSGLEEGEAQQAVDIVQAVVAWYTEKIAAERRAPLPDGERIAQLTADRTAAYQDLQRLEDADPEEEDRLAELYAARLRQLES